MLFHYYYKLFHNLQNSNLNPTCELYHIWLEDLIEMAESCASSEIYPLLKREDEKFVTEHAYDNPKFVEDVLRDVVLLLRNNDIIDSFEVECESIESIHNHSAWAYQSEG